MAQPGTDGGRLPARVYWVRRALALAFVVAVVLAAVAVVNRVRGPGDDDATASPEVSATPTVAPTSGAPATPAPTVTGDPVPGGCPPEELDVSVAPEADPVPAGRDAILTVTVTHTGDGTCPVDLGAGAVLVQVFAADDAAADPQPLWSSDDCQGEVERRVAELADGASDVTLVVWPRTAPAECDRADEPSPAGSYRVSARVAGSVATDAVITLD